MGFFALALGLKENEILGAASFQNDRVVGLIPSIWNIPEKDRIYQKLYVINDTPVGDILSSRGILNLVQNGVLRDGERMTEEKREQLIIEYFAKIGVNVTFVN